jgi:hypothetical protein
MEAIKSLLQANQGNKSTLNRAYNKNIYNIQPLLSEEVRKHTKTPNFLSLYISINKSK